MLSASTKVIYFKNYCRVIKNIWHSFISLQINTNKNKLASVKVLIVFLVKETI